MVVEGLNAKLAAFRRTIEQVVSDVVTALGILPGWTVTAMADFIRAHHGVPNPMSVAQVKSAYVDHLKSGQERRYSAGYVTHAESRLSQFVKRFGQRPIDSLTPEEILQFINGFRVKALLKKDRSRADEDGSMPASQKTKRLVHDLLLQLFGHAKRVLRALPPRLQTAVDVLPAPEFDFATPEVYTPAELARLYGLLPDIESILFVSLQLFAGLRPSEAVRVRSEDIKRDTNGGRHFILVAKEVGRKCLQTGRRRVRTRKAPITRPLAALLSAVKLPEGRLFLSKKMEDKVSSRARDGKFPWKRNGLRNSFLAYRLAELGDRARVAYEAGIQRDFRFEQIESPVEISDAPAYWAFDIKVDGLPYTVNPLVANS
jgi:integrase